MKNKKIIILILLVSLTNKISSQYLNIPDSLINNKLINVELKQDTNKTVYLFVENNMKDTVVLKSKFTLDLPMKLSHVLIYKCKVRKNDSTEVCNFGYFTLMAIDPVVKTFSNGFITIPPNKKIMLEFFRKEEDEDFDIYFSIQCLVKYKDQWFVVRKKTNKI